MEIDEKVLLDKYGITTSVKTVYHYQENKYDKLSDAVNYAKIDANRADSATEKDVGSTAKKT